MPEAQLVLRVGVYSEKCIDLRPILVTERGGWLDLPLVAQVQEEFGDKVFLCSFAISITGARRLDWLRSGSGAVRPFFGEPEPEPEVRFGNFANLNLGFMSKKVKFEFPANFPSQIFDFLRF